MSEQGREAAYSDIDGDPLKHVVASSEVLEAYRKTLKAIFEDEARVVEDGECPVCHGEKVVTMERLCFRCQPNPADTALDDFAKWCDERGVGKTEYPYPVVSRLAEYRAWALPRNR